MITVIITSSCVTWCTTVVTQMSPSVAVTVCSTNTVSPPTLYPQCLFRVDMQYTMFDSWSAFALQLKAICIQMLNPTKPPYVDCYLHTCQPRDTFSRDKMASLCCVPRQQCKIIGNARNSNTILKKCGTSVPFCGTRDIW